MCRHVSHTFNNAQNIRTLKSYTSLWGGCVWTEKTKLALSVLGFCFALVFFFFLLAFFFFFFCFTRVFFFSSFLALFWAAHRTRTTKILNHSVFFVCDVFWGPQRRTTKISTRYPNCPTNQTHFPIPFPHFWPLYQYFGGFLRQWNAAYLYVAALK